MWKVFGQMFGSVDILDLWVPRSDWLHICLLDFVFGRQFSEDKKEMEELDEEDHGGL